MNYGIILHILGLAGCFEALFLVMPAAVALIYGEKVFTSYLISIVLCAAASGALLINKPKKRTMYAREGFVAVALVWVWMSVFGAVPFVLTGEIPFYVDALFETISGFTTTGASILTNVEALSRASLFWRSFTHWVGGMGILVFILAIMPNRGNGTSVHLMRAESPGPSVSKLVPRIRYTAMILYAIYFGMTLLEIILLRAAGMPLFDAVTLSFGTAGTGGFAIKCDSVGGYTMLQQGIITVFMILFGVNFTFYYCLLTKKKKQVFAMTEVWTYLVIITVSILAIGLNITPMFDNAGLAFHHAAFQVGSIITTTGFGTVDFNLWPAFSKTILVTLMFIGACAGSTGGGIKVSRLILLVKGITKEISLSIHPRSVRKVKMEGRTVESEIIRSVNAFIALYLIIFVLSVLAVSLDEMDLVTNFTAVAATLNNIGPGLEVVGPAGNFSSFSAFSKLVLCFDMLAGRLELMPMLMLLVPFTWKR